MGDGLRVRGNLPVFFLRIPFGVRASFDARAFGCFANARRLHDLGDATLVNSATERNLNRVFGQGHQYTQNSASMEVYVMPPGSFHWTQMYLLLS